MESTQLLTYPKLIRVLIYSYFNPTHELIQKIMLLSKKERDLVQDSYLIPNKQIKISPCAYPLTPPFPLRVAMFADIIDIKVHRNQAIFFPTQELSQLSDLFHVIVERLQQKDTQLRVNLTIEDYSENFFNRIAKMIFDQCQPQIIGQKLIVNNLHIDGRLRVNLTKEMYFLIINSRSFSLADAIYNKRKWQMMSSIAQKGRRSLGASSTAARCSSFAKSLRASLTPIKTPKS
ncbi:hypothetical protein FGO68_gene4455 [Halteria grandinella]|uniref:Uncharacterized protein n=1 Tax=Halteria grandinella TaxID=5974 RepID=A0A8J8NMJ9_HALGN|nr:hypothetical protein FGO68_gene4455 [Halteria grandinella]